MGEGKMGKQGRRSKALVGAIAIGAAATFATASSAAAGELHALAWEGYTDESLTSAFAERTGCEVKTTYIGSNEEILAKLAGGAASAYDIISPDVDAMRPLIELGAIESLDPARLEHFDTFPDEFRNHPDVKDASGTIWGVPYVWGGIPI